MLNNLYVDKAQLPITEQVLQPEVLNFYGILPGPTDAGTTQNQQLVPALFLVETAAPVLLFPLPTQRGLLTLYKGSP